MAYRQYAMPTEFVVSCFNYCFATMETGGDSDIVSGSLLGTRRRPSVGDGGTGGAASQMYAGCFWCTYGFGKHFDGIREAYDCFLIGSAG